MDADDVDIEMRLLPPRKVLVIGASIGAGHNSAAWELQRRLQCNGLSAVYFDILDAVPFIFKVILCDLYGPIVNYAPSLFSRFMASWESDSSWTVRILLWSVSTRKVLEQIRGASVVVTTHAIATQAVGRLKQQGKHEAVIVSYFCDAGIHQLLFHQEVDLNLVPVPEAVQQCAKYGHTAVAITPLVQSKFRSPVPQHTCYRLRQRLGLAAESAVILIVAGSLGIGSVGSTVSDILDQMEAVLIVVLCGRNSTLQRSLSTIPRVTALGWREDISELLAIAQAMVHNAGGMAVWEAMVTGLPATTYNPLPGHGMANARALEQSGLSPWPRDRRDLRLALEHALQMGRREPTIEDEQVVVDHIARMMQRANDITLL
ncbi:uncharacterized protein PG986_014474 [Apiospora aurea]|uniref:UDP-N-acetylglucosamine transferase subunit ALG13 n=1 Tax=Apiospora aurea TaxID=335848 RepID=A0ABR1PT30_9PEZI